MRKFILVIGICITTAHSYANSVTCQGLFSENEIIHFHDGSEIPRSLFEELDSKTIGKVIVERIRRLSENDKAHPYETQYDLMKNSQIVLFFPVEKIKPIVEKGFLNKHQLGGGMIANMHKKAEKVLSGLSFDLGDPNKANYVLPKYAYLDLTTRISLQKRFLTDDTLYGNVMAVMKDEVKDRSTWTYNDSLMLAQEIKPEEARKSFLGTFLRGSIDSQQPGAYFEAQIWGALDITDVKFLGIDSDFPLNRIEDLYVAGVPIYRMERIFIGGRISYKPTTLIWAPQKSEH